ncbi:DUF2185 domain-containing protein [Streptococcus oricebi]|uniref:DUF2185 domain-containing protein n=2 Tax=Streptococcus oricebi TaxID=1547447 RepID=A0ABS5B5Y6_9STRE|nr:DUF2185 domain-containing protein [Streptococcus oricebi]
MGLGGSVVSNNILTGAGKMKWFIREEFLNNLDNGWRILSDIDTDEYLSDPANMSICDWRTVFELEPAVMAIFDLPIGTEVTLIYGGEEKYFVDSRTGERIL